MPKSQNHQGYSCRVNILKYVKVDGKWRFAPAQTQNNKLKQDCIMVDGRAERHPEGTYYIEWYENGVRRRQSVKDSAEVLERWQLQQYEPTINQLYERLSNHPIFRSLKIAIDLQAKSVTIGVAVDHEITRGSRSTGHFGSPKISKRSDRFQPLCRYYFPGGQE